LGLKPFVSKGFVTTNRVQRDITVFLLCCQSSVLKGLGKLKVFVVYVFGTGEEIMALLVCSWKVGLELLVFELF
jgi:hypothetical protein